MSKYDLPKKFDHKDIDILKPFITETGKIMKESLLFLSQKSPLLDQQ